jgi:hypothetical protein
VIDKPSFHERRKSPRAFGNVPLKIAHEEGDIVTETVNISRSGAYCCVDRYVEPMTKMKINLLLPLKKGGRSLTKKVACGGVVVRTEPAEKKGLYNIAIFFSDISQRDAEVISDYVEEYINRVP